MFFEKSQKKATTLAAVLRDAVVVEAQREDVVVHEDAELSPQLFRGRREVVGVPLDNGVRELRVVVAAVERELVARREGRRVGVRADARARGRPGDAGLPAGEARELDDDVVVVRGDVAAPGERQEVRVRVGDEAYACRCEASRKRKKL